MLRCGSVRFSDVVNPAMRFGYILCFMVRYGAVLKYRKTYGAVRFGFEMGKNPTVRFDAVDCTEPHRTVRENRTVKNPGYFLRRHYPKKTLYAVSYTHLTLPTICSV